MSPPPNENRRHNPKCFTHTYTHTLKQLFLLYPLENLFLKGTRLFHTRTHQSRFPLSYLRDLTGGAGEALGQAQLTIWQSSLAVFDVLSNQTHQ